MTEENPNGCAEPIGQALRRHGVPETLVADIERDYRELFKLTTREQPRTITLAYTPRLADDDRNYSDEGLDTGGHWTVFEQGRACEALDSRECLALVAAMLLGAPHPPLRSIFGFGRQASRDRMARREAEREAGALRDSLEQIRRGHSEDMRALRELHGSLPWELAQVLFGELRRGTDQPAKPEDGREVFTVPLLELAKRLGILAAKPAPEPDHVDVPVRVDERTAAVLELAAEDAGVTRDQAASVVASIGVRRALENDATTLGLADRLLEHPDYAAVEANRIAALYGKTATLQLDVGDLGRFTLTGVPVAPLHFGPYSVSCQFEPCGPRVNLGVAAIKADGDRLVDALAAQGEELDHASAELERETELLELVDGLTEAGHPRTTHELRAWPSDWRIDAQNFASAFAAWKSRPGRDDGSDAEAWMASKPRAPWFLTGAPEPLESIEARAAEEHAGFGLEPLGGDLEPPADPVPGDAAPGVLSQVIAGAASAAVPRSAVAGAPRDDFPL